MRVSVAALTFVFRDIEPIGGLWQMLLTTDKFATLTMLALAIWGAAVQQDHALQTLSAISKWNFHREHEAEKIANARQWLSDRKLAPEKT